MRAWTVSSEVGYPVLVTRPSKTNGLKVEIQAAALNHRDLWICKGLYAGIKPGAILGSDGCGVFEDKEVIINPSIAWGSQQKCQSPEFRVLGMPDDGTFADCIYIEPPYIFDKPEHLDTYQAAALPLAGLTAFRALFSRAEAKKGEKVLIHGVGGGVALIAMQMAIAIGCKVFVTSGNDEKINKALDMGAIGGYNYKDEHWPSNALKDTDGFDVIVDGACGNGFNDLIKVATSGGRISIYGATLGNMESCNARSIFWKQLTIMGSTMGSPSDFLSMLDLVRDYKIVPIVDKVFRFDDLHAALQYMEAGKQFGKIVISLK